MQEGTLLKIKTNPKSGAVIFHTDIKRAKVGDQPVGLVTTQAFFNPREKLNPDGSLKAIKESEEFLIMQVWGCRMSVINTAGCPLPLISILLQVPEGAIPLGGERAFYTRNLDLEFDADETETIDYFFYFPTPGSFHHYPLHVACDNEIIARAEPRTLVVAERPKGVDTNSWDSVGRLGSDAEVVAFMKRAPKLGDLGLDFVSSRLMSKVGKARSDFYKQIVDVYRERLVYLEDWWSFGFVTHDEQSIAELLATRQSFVKECGPYLETKLLSTKDKTLRFEYHEFAPYIHPRVHTKDGDDGASNDTGASSGRGKGGKGLGQKSYNCNNNTKKKSVHSSTETTEGSVNLPWQLSAAYHLLIDRLVYSQRPTRLDLAHICFFHLRANRIAVARGLFADIGDSMDDSDDLNSGGELQLQLDYLAAYLDLYGAPQTGNDGNTPQGHDFAVARSIAEKYKSYPILHWRAMFNEIQSILSRSSPLTTEAITQQVLARDEGAVVQQGGGLHIESARLELEIKGNSLEIAWHPGKPCTDSEKQVFISYYAMDIEVIFSRDPFADQNRISPHLLVNRPTVETIVSLPAPSTPGGEEAYIKKVDLPQHLVGLPLVVQVRDPTSDRECTRTYLGSSALVAHAIQQEGALQVYEKVSMEISEHVKKRQRTSSSPPPPSSSSSPVYFQPLGGCYVKVFRTDTSSNVEFYKDGYTDVAGRFDYVARTAKDDMLSSTRSFAILVLAPNKGAVKLLV